MKPYFETNLGKLYNMDCLEFMATMPDKSVDLVLTDPPYGMGIDKQMSLVAGQKHGKAAAPKKDYGFSDWDILPKKEYFNEMLRVSNNQIIFGGNYFTNFLPASRCYLVWDKKTDDKFSNCFADAELAWCSFDKPIKIYRYLWTGMIQEDMKNKIERQHPTQKPDGLITKILRDYATGGGVIADFFMGSGTTAVACEKLGRRWIGCEISERYCEIAAARIKAESDQLKLFI